MSYKGAPLYFQKRVKLEVEIDNAWIQMLIQNYEHLPPLITIVEASYAWLLRSLDVVVRMHKILSIKTVTQAMRRNQVMLDVDKYIGQLMRVATNDDLQLSIDSMQRYINRSAKLSTMLGMLQDPLD